MNIEYITDHPVRPLEEWTGKQSHDWLHPTHGPLPHKIGAIRCEKDEYCVSMWLLENRIVTVTELVDTVDVNKGWGNRENKKGWIINSLNWRPTEDSFECEGQHVMVPAVLKHHADQDQEESFYKQIMMLSVEITVRTALGAPVTYPHQLMKG
jgi:hypothetical protein